jgi:uncharacterized membrane protein (UPF0127 family)
MNRRLIFSIVAVLILGIGIRIAESQQAPSFPVSTLTIATAAGKHLDFRVEVARSPEQQEYGLMFRKQMDRQAGMIFIQPQDRVMTMWMKNTILPLDMVFFADDGTIMKVFPDAVPESTDIISSGGPVRGVIELNAGVAKALGIAAGDKVISQDIAAP